MLKHFFQAQEGEKQANRREFNALMDRKVTTADDHQVLDRHSVSFAAMTSRHSREIRVPRESFYEFVDKTIDRFTETSKCNNYLLFIRADDLVRWRGCSNHFVTMYVCGWVGVSVCNIKENP